MREYNGMIAETTLEIQEGSFFNSWRFLWDGELVRATVGIDIPKITILTDHKSEDLEGISEFILQTAERIKNDDYEDAEDDLESGNRSR